MGHVGVTCGRRILSAAVLNMMFSAREIKEGKCEVAFVILSW